MSFLYPAGYDIEKLSSLALALKIARHSRCTVCDNCPGLHPIPGTPLTLDLPGDDILFNDVAHFESDEEKDSRYLQTCACGHGIKEHGDGRIDKGEYARRGRVAVRMDELLMVL